MSASSPPVNTGITPPARVDVTMIRPHRAWSMLDAQALWDYRELLYFLVWRDLKVRYKQTALGVAWAVLQPVATVFLFSIVFGNFAKLPSDGVPYPIYAFSALLPWMLLSGAINRSGTSLVSSANLVSKVYFPRIIVPMSGALGAFVDFGISLVVLFGLMVFYGVQPTAALLTLPIWAGLVLMLGMSVGLALSALNVKFRDVGYLLSFLLQAWMYASPVAYSPTIVPEHVRWIYNLNPMVGFIQGCRWALLGTSGDYGIPWVPAVAVVTAVFLGAVVYFHRVERNFADLI
ncbi:MAG: type transporter [Armatimonadetes bacterium]|jgi:lipopolysaccharide transport system permease protein|nr:type transporter [Armatimonadota bacterium]